MPSRLVVLGGCGAWPEGGRACSGFVLEHDGFRVILDLGYATLPPLLALLGSPAADGIDAVVVTHKHPDHMVDLHGLFRARWNDRRGAPAIPLYCLDLTAREAGQAARAARAHRLLLTHFWPGNDRDAARAEAAGEFGGEILIADENLGIQLP